MKKLLFLLQEVGKTIFRLQLTSLRENVLKYEEENLFHRHNWYFAYSILLASMFTFVQSSAQSSNINGIIIQGTEIDIPSNEGGLSQNAVLNELLNAFGVASYSIAYPVAKTKKAKNCFNIILEKAIDSDYEKLALELKAMNYEEVLLKKIPEATECSDPVGYNDPCVQGDAGHYITNANLPCAWSITQGDPDIIIALADEYMDYTHDDLFEKIVSIWSKPNGGIIPACSGQNHGFVTAGAMAAIVDNNYCVAGSGNNSRVAFYSVNDGWCVPAYVGEAILQAYADGHKIINVSWAWIPIVNSMMQEIIDSGVTIVHSCGGEGWHSLYADIPGIIGVGQLDKDLNYVPYPAFGGVWDGDVDIYAPCIDVCRLEKNNTCVLGKGNSSLGAAMTSGIVALIKSVNSNLCPSAIENIIELSNQGFPTNYDQWKPKMTQGVIDAEAAVILAQNFGKYTITTPTVWDKDRFVSELSIEPGGELTIRNCKISMGENAAVIVKRNARLILDNASMYDCGAQWGGIRVWGNYSKPQPAYTAPLTDSEQCGIVSMFNSSIIGAKIGISTTAPGLSWPLAAEYYGGLIHCDNVNFLDCRKAVEFMKYPNPLPKPLFINTSKFSECRFEEENDLVNGSEGVTIWDTDGIEFTKCHFKNLDSDGIVIGDAWAKVYDACKFQKNKRGILSTATYPYSAHIEIGSTSSTPNTFTENKIHIDATATNNLGGISIWNNNFTNGDKGVYLEGPCNYTIARNTFDNQVVGIHAVNTGSMNAFQDNFVQCNAFSDEMGVYFDGENRDVQILGNTFLNSNEDITVKQYNLSGIGGAPGAIREKQGDLTKPTGNCFSSATIPDIVTTGNTVKFRYYHHAKAQPCLDVPNNPGNYQKVGTPGVSVDCSTLVDSSGIKGEPPTREDLTNIRNNIFTLEQQVTANPLDETLFSNLLDKKGEKEQILKSLLEQALSQKDYTEAESLLAGENSKAAKHVIFGLKLERGDYQDAKSYLLQLPSLEQEDIDFKTVQTINIDRLENGTDFLLTPETTSTLEQIAYGTTVCKVYAQAILTLLTGQRFEREALTSQRQKQITNNEPKDIGLMTIMPNPTQRVANILFKKEAPQNSVLVVVNQHGHIMSRYDISGQKQLLLDTETFANGIYFVKAILGTGASQQSKIVVTH